MKYYLKTTLIFLFILYSSQVLSAKTEVFVSILPQQYLVEQIGAEQVSVTVMVKPGQSPETFEPSPKVMARYAQADVYFTIAMPFEKVWINRVASLNQSIQIVNTQILTQNAQKFDPHTWLSPLLIMQQANIIKDELIRLAPDHKAYFLTNYKRLIKNINALHQQLSALFKANNKHRFITFHPAFSYFSREYSLTQKAIEVEGKEPSAKQISRIISEIKEQKVHYIIVEKQFNQVIARTIAHSVSAQLLVVDPLALDYLSNMRDLAEKINKALF